MRLYDLSDFSTGSGVRIAGPESWFFLLLVVLDIGQANSLLLPLFFLSKMGLWTFLVAQWLRIHLPIQGTRVWSLVRGDPTCRGASKPVCHNYWACALEPVSHNYWARAPQLLRPARPRARALQQLNPRAATTEAMHSMAHVLQLLSNCWSPNT